MKKYFIRKRGQKSRPHYPFWMPWGAGGCLGRILGFFLTIILWTLLLWLLAGLFRNCSGYNSGNNGIDGYDPSEIIDLPDTVPADLPPLKQVLPDSIPGPENPIDDPNDPVRKIDANQLIVIIDPQGKQKNAVLEQFASEFKGLYPGEDYKVLVADPETMLMLLSVPQDMREEIKNSLPGKITDIKFYIEDASIIIPHESASVDDPYFNHEGSWYFDAVKAPEAWQLTTGSPNVKVAVIDSYFDLSHADFKGLKVEKPLSLENGTTNVLPPGDNGTSSYYHGTHVLGTIATQMNNSIGTTGIAPNVTVMPISLGQNISSFNLLYGMLYALYNGADVINLSIGAALTDMAEGMSVEEQVEYAKKQLQRESALWNYVDKLMNDRNCLLVYSSGNSNLFTLMDEMKRSDNIVIVDAVDESLNKADFSNFANVPELGISKGVISAPGVNILNNVPNHRLASLNGTSMAAPIVTGAVALMKSIDPSLTNKEVIEILEETALPLDDKKIAPLLQIRPALDKVKSRIGDWDEFKKNPVAIWKTTEQFPITSVETGEWVADCNQYVVFDSSNSGVVELHALGADKVWNSRFKSVIRGDSAVLTFEPQKSVEGDIYIPNKFVIYPDENRKISIVSYVNNSGNNKINLLKRLKEDDRKNTNKRKI